VQDEILRRLTPQNDRLRYGRSPWVSIRFALNALPAALTLPTFYEEWQVDFGAELYNAKRKQ